MQIISSFSASYLDGALASYETDLDLFKHRVMQHSRLPKNGWKRKASGWRYICDDYLVDIIQDYGAVKSAVGPTVMVYSKYSDIWESVRK